MLKIGCALLMVLAMLLTCCGALGEERALSTPALPGASSRLMLKNPNRGFRLETYMSVGSGKYTPDLYTADGDYKGPEGASDAEPWLVNFLYDYKNESPVMSQVYFYLTEYRDRDLDQTAFDHMTSYFALCRKLNVTVALRFAYLFTQHQEEKQDCVSLEQMLRHMEQLKPLLAENRDVIFVLEGGFFGEWGECSGDSPWARRGDVGAIINGIVRMCPPDLPIVTRYQWVRDKALAAFKSRIGYHDDYIVGYSHPWSTGGLWDSDAFAVYQKASSRVVVEGEMPWGAQSEALDPWGVAKYLSDLHYTALSCYHHYREGGGLYCLRRARDIAATPDLIAEKGLRVPYDAWFKDAEGNEITRSLFEYIRDFLGYHIAASEAALEEDADSLTISLTLTNYGFAAPLAMKGVDIVLLDDAYQPLSATPLCALNALAPGEATALSLTLERAEGARYIGLSLYNAAGTGARLANDLPFENGVNILGELAE